MASLQATVLAERSSGRGHGKFFDTEAAARARVGFRRCSTRIEIMYMPKKLAYREADTAPLPFACYRFREPVRSGRGDSDE
jgi:hypothetical protein